MLALGKLAFEQLEKAIRFSMRMTWLSVISTSVKHHYTQDSARRSSERSVGCTWKRCTALCHLTIQEFLAALYVFLSFNNSNVNLMTKKKPTSQKLLKMFNENPTTNKSAVNKALEWEWTPGSVPPLPSGPLSGVQSDSSTRATDTNRKQRN